MSKDQITDEDRAMAKTMADYWTNFAKTGDPNGAGLPTWPTYTQDNDTWLDLGTQIEPLPGYRAKDMDFWEMRYLKYLE